MLKKRNEEENIFSTLKLVQSERENPYFNENLRVYPLNPSKYEAHGPLKPIGDGDDSSLLFFILVNLK